MVIIQQVFLFVNTHFLQYYMQILQIFILLMGQQFLVKLFGQEVHHQALHFPLVLEGVDFRLFLVPAVRDRGTDGIRIWIFMSEDVHFISFKMS